LADGAVEKAGISGKDFYPIGIGKIERNVPKSKSIFGSTFTDVPMCSQVALYPATSGSTTRQCGRAFLERADGERNFNWPIEV
jgi:hypothetical protein